MPTEAGRTAFIGGSAAHGERLQHYLPSPPPPPLRLEEGATPPFTYPGHFTSRWLSGCPPGWGGGCLTPTVSSPGCHTNRQPPVPHTATHGAPSPRLRTHGPTHHGSTDPRSWHGGPSRLPFEAALPTVGRSTASGRWDHCAHRPPPRLDPMGSSSRRRTGSPGRRWWG